MANPTPTPGEATRGTGPDQLGYGDATQTNEELAAGDAIEEEIASQELVQEAPQTQPTFEGEEVPVEYSDEEEPDYQAANEMEEIMFGESMGIGVNPYKNVNRPVPNSVLRALPQLSAIMADPTVPASIKAMYQTVIERLANELDKRH